MPNASSSPEALLRIVAEGGTLATWTDADLVARFAESRRRPDDLGSLAFEVLVRRHGPMVRGVCRRALADPVDADDAFQATFLVLVRRAGAVRVADSLGPWLFGVASRVARRARLVRDRQRLREGSGGGFVPDLGAPEPGDARLAEVLGALDAEVARLPEPFRSALLLCDLGGLSVEEAGRQAGCPPGTIKSRLHRARARLRARLSLRGFGAMSSPAIAALGRPAPLPDALVASAVARVASSPSAGPIRSLLLRFLGLAGTHKMTSLMMTRWGAAAALSAALGVAGTAYVGPRPGQAPADPKDSPVVPARPASVLLPQAAPAPAQAPANPNAARVPANPASALFPQAAPKPGQAPAAPNAARVPTNPASALFPQLVSAPTGPVGPIIKASDRLAVELIEDQSPSRITGEHAVRPDGRVALGKFGEVEVAGLTTSQAKERIIQHLRRDLTDAELGLKPAMMFGPPGEVAPVDSDRLFVDVVSDANKTFNNGRLMQAIREQKARQVAEASDLRARIAELEKKLDALSQKLNPPTQAAGK